MGLVRVVCVPAASVPDVQMDNVPVVPTASATAGGTQVETARMDSVG